MPCGTLPYRARLLRSHLVAEPAARRVDLLPFLWNMNLQRAAFSLRPATDGDRGFLYALHCRTMRVVIEQTWGWDEDWQQMDFERRFRDHDVSIIECDGEATGGLFLERRTDSLYIHEIQLTPEFQGSGIGSAVVGQVIEQAAITGCPRGSPSSRRTRGHGSCTNDLDFE